ncbi:Bromodomain-containing protein [Dactylonectria estremocensis]|uniref:Bromodomain-containing protein n=1 Tax=Dactylonectria estremocensis TaxID=1079267 RepID=A0A9P9J5X9_9HYPO|nr:Bromodomain-containing protein [Dactylonectria estremocensis]
MNELARQPRHGPNYNQLLHPMDLDTMEAKLEADQYMTPEDFIKDAQLIFANCRKYNDENTSNAKCANKLEKYM